MDPINVVSLAISLVALAVSCIGARYARDSNRIAQEANLISRDAFEAENSPRITINLMVSAKFETEQILPAMKVTHIPSEIAVLVARVSNEGRIPVTIREMNINANLPDEKILYVEFPTNDVESYTFPNLPYELMGYRSADFPIRLSTVRSILEQIDAEQAGVFKVRMVDAIGRTYSSFPLDVDDFIDRDGYHSSVSAQFRDEEVMDSGTVAWDVSHKLFKDYGQWIVQYKVFEKQEGDSSE